MEKYKFEARSTKSETISNDQNTNAQNNVLNLENLNLEFVSSFEFRISDFFNGISIKNIPTGEKFEKKNIRNMSVNYYLLCSNSSF
ncbi:MAG: hypothetical protein Q7J67_02320 [bacterium]|nr:hypothetical protein [bacterium]